MRPEIIDPVSVKSEGGCAIACVATLVSSQGHSLQDVSMAADKIRTGAPKKGLYLDQIIRLAKKFGLPLIKVKVKDIEPDDTGILYTRDHAVVMFHGVIYDPFNGVWYTYDVFTNQKTHRPLGFLRA